MERRIPSSILRAILLTAVFAATITSFTVSGQDSRSAVKADSARVVSLDAMLDHVDAVVRRLEERSEGSTSLRSASSPSGYVGTIPMTAGVSPSGARTYSIPIMTVDVPGGAPAVSLEYNSQGGHGAAGYGWEIGGISTVTAANKTPYYNDTTIAASAVYNSSWALDGMPLVQHTEEGMGSYSLRTVRGNVFVYPAGLTFQALNPDGSKATYGDGLSMVGAINAVTRREDRNGNLILYEYATVGTGRPLPSRIRYGGRTESACTSSIVFTYDTRTDVPTAYHAGAYANPGGLLKRVTCYEGEDVLAQYDLTHVLRDGVWVLTRVDCSRDGVPLQPLTFACDPSAPDQHALTSGTVYFSSGYSSGTPLVISRGKLLEGSFEDGIVFHPQYNQYSPSGGSNNSGYPTNMAIAVAPPPLSDSFVGLKTNVTTGAGFQVITPIDADGDGTDELVKVNFGSKSGENVNLVITVYRYDGTAVVQRSVSTVSVKGRVSAGNSNRSARMYHFGDFTGCGHGQLLTTTCSKGTDYAALIDLSSGTALCEAAMPSALAWNADVLVLDINRDGRTEVCLPADNGLRVYTVKDSGALVLDRIFNWGSGGNPYSSSTARNFIADVNGDGYPDIMTAPANKLYTSWTAHFFTGEGFSSRTVQCGIFDPDNDTALFMDVNRDGLPDYVKAAPYYLNIHLNNHASNFSPDSPLLLAREAGMEMVPVNMAQLGAESHALMVSGAKAVLVRDAAQAPRLRETASSTDGFGNTTLNTYADLSTDPLTGEEEPVHYVVDGSYVPDASAGFARLAAPLRVLYAERTYMGSSSGEASTDVLLSKVFHVRKNAVVSTRGLGFVGFASTGTYDKVREVRAQTTFDPAMFGVPTFSKTYLYQQEDSPFLTVTNTWSPYTTAWGRLDPRLTASVSVDALSGVTTTSSHYYDSWGYPTKETVMRSVAAVGALPADEKGSETSYTYSHAVGATKYILGAVTRVYTEPRGRLYGTANTMDGEPATDLWSRKTEWTYDALMRPVTRLEYSWLKTTYLNEDLLPEEISADYDTAGSGAKGQGGEEDEISLDYDVTVGGARGPEDRDDKKEDKEDKEDGGGGPLRVPKIFTGGDLETETRWTYDARGNVTREQVYRHGASSPLETSWTFDSSGRHLDSVTDPLGLTTTYSGYDIFGNPASVTDHTGTTAYTYDTWGRLTRTDQPSKAWEDESRDWGGKGLFTVFSRNSLGERDSTHYDAAGRAVRHSDRRFNNTWRKTERQYDAAGRLWKETLPFKSESSSSKRWNTRSYDAYGRLTALAEASGRTTSYAYAGRVTSVTSDGVTTTTTADADGAAVLVHDPGGDIAFVVRPDGQPAKTTAPGGAVTAFEYDEWGDRKKIVAPSFGTQTDVSVWNTDGTSLTTTTNRYGTVVSSFDIHGRPVSVVRTAAASGTGSFSTTYSYNANGLLVSESSSNGTSRTFTYDAFDRLKTETETAAGLSFSATRVYSDTTANGPVGSVRYVNYKLGTTIIARETFSYTYGHLKKTALSQCTGVTAGTTVWQLTAENALGQPTAAATLGITRAYAYSAYGLPTSRRTGTLTEGYTVNAQNGNLTSRTPPAPSGGTAPGTESFTYGALNRIASWTRPGSSTGATATAVYDNKGNITSLSTSGTMSYGGGTSDPYSMTGYTPASSASARTLPTVMYDPLGHPSSITSADDYSVALEYGADGKRMRMMVYDDKEKVSLERIYLGDRLEVDRDKNGTVIAQRLWLGGDAYDAPVVLTRSGSSGNWTAHNVGRDILGSVTSVQSASGTIEEQRSYDPWGRARDPQTLVLYSAGSEPSYMLGRGFTGHEWLPNAALWNANARLYDPLLGRFLSPDPFVQAPGFTQNYNRFAYALNCPLKYTDPSGEIAWFIPVIGALMGGIGNVLSNRDSVEEKGFWGFFFVGAAVGAASAFAGDWIAGVTKAAGVWGGALIGAGTGAATGAATSTITTIGNNWISGNNWNNGLGASVLSGTLWGGVSGALSGGIRGYHYAKEHGANPWSNRIEESSFEATVKKDVALQKDPSAYCYGYSAAYADAGHGNHKAIEFIQKNSNLKGGDFKILGEVSKDAHFIGRFSLEKILDNYINFGLNIQNSLFEAAGTIDGGNVKHWVNIIGVSNGKLSMFGGKSNPHLFLKIWNPFGGKVSWINGTHVNDITVFRYL